MSTVREDEHGLYIMINGAKTRPGGVSGHDHVLDMSDGGLKKGDKVKAYKQNGNMITTLTLDDGSKRYWSCYEPDYHLRTENLPPLEERIRARDELLEQMKAQGLRIMQVR